jgi:hypothetical protein
MAKFQVQGDALQLVNNLFFMNRLGDYGHGGSGCCNVADFEDDTAVQAGQERPRAAQVRQQGPPAVLRPLLDDPGDRERRQDQGRGAARRAKVGGLGEYAPVGFEKKYTKHAELPQAAPPTTTAATRRPSR